MDDLDALQRDIADNSVGLDPASIAAALAALVNLVSGCRNKTPAAAAITGKPKTAETILLRGAIRRELRERGERATPDKVEPLLNALLNAQIRADAATRQRLADDLTKWDLA